MTAAEPLDATRCDPASLGLAWNRRQAQTLAHSFISAAGYQVARGEAQSADALLQAAKVLCPNDLVSCACAFVLIRGGRYTQALDWLGGLNIPEAQAARAFCTFMLGSPGYQVMVHEVLQSGHAGATALIRSWMPAWADGCTQDENRLAAASRCTGIRA